MGIYYSELYGVDRVFSNDIFDEKPTFDSDEIPAWSLHRLWELAQIRQVELIEIGEIAKIYDFVIDDIESQIKEGYFNKEYLCEK